MKKVKIIKGQGCVYKSTDDDYYVNNYIKKLIQKHHTIYLENLPQNIVNKYFVSLKQNCILNTGIPNIKDTSIIHEIGNKSSRSHYSHYRIIYKDNNFIYKIINFYDSSIKEFLKETKYDVMFHQSIHNNFYDNISLVSNFIYDKINNRYIGYKYPIMNHIKKINTKKLDDLINRLVEQYKKTNIMYCDLVYHNIMEYNNKYYIIDLETVTDISTYKKFHTKWFKNNNKTYESLVFLHK